MKIYQQQCSKINEESLNLMIRKYGNCETPEFIEFPKITVKDYEGYKTPDQKVLCEHIKSENVCDKDNKVCYLSR